MGVGGRSIWGRKWIVSCLHIFSPQGFRKIVWRPTRGWIRLRCRRMGDNTRPSLWGGLFRSLERPGHFQRVLLAGVRSGNVEIYEILGWLPLAWICDYYFLAWCRYFRFFVMIFVCLLIMPRLIAPKSSETLSQTYQRMIFTSGELITVTTGSVITRQVRRIIVTTDRKNESSNRAAPCLCRMIAAMAIAIETTPCYRRYGKQLILIVLLVNTRSRM